MPHLPKPLALRQRTNRHSTAATLPTEAAMSDAVVPALPRAPDGGWHHMVHDFWADVWRSPMASEYTKTDIHLLHMLAQVIHDFWSATKPTARQAALREMRLTGMEFGLSPIARRRLQWEIDKGDEAEERVTRRRQAKQPKAGSDPRDLLKVVNS